MNEILKMLINSQATDQIKEQTGLSPKETASVVEAVLPMLLRGMESQAQNESTKQGFMKAVKDHGKDDSSDIANFLKNVDVDDGAKIVNHLLGSEAETVAAKANKKSGVSTKTILKVMAIIAPLLMSKLGNKANEKKSDDMLGLIGGLMDGVDTKDIIKIAGLLLK